MAEWVMALVSNLMTWFSTLWFTQRKKRTKSHMLFSDNHKHSVAYMHPSMHSTNQQINIIFKKILHKIFIFKIMNTCYLTVCTQTIFLKKRWENLSFQKFRTLWRLMIRIEILLIDEKSWLVWPKKSLRHCCIMKSWFYWSRCVRPKSWCEKSRRITGVWEVKEISRVPWQIRDTVLSLGNYIHAVRRRESLSDTQIHNSTVGLICWA